MANSMNDYDKLKGCFENHLEAIYGDKWDQLSAREICKLLAGSALGLNGGTPFDIPKAGKKLGFKSHHVVGVNPDTFHVLSLTEFQSEQPN